MPLVSQQWINNVLNRLRFAVLGQLGKENKHRSKLISHYLPKQCFDEIFNSKTWFDWEVIKFVHSLV